MSGGCLADKSWLGLGHWIRVDGAFRQPSFFVCFVAGGDLNVRLFSALSTHGANFIHISQ